MHRIITGMTQSGKSTLAKLICRELKTRGISTGVLDPLGDSGWDCSFQTKHNTEFLDWAKDTKNCRSALFVDESGQSIGKYNQEMEWITTAARHWGHISYVICQRATQIAPVVRTNCSDLFLFSAPEKDLQLYSEEWNDSRIKEVRLEKGEFLIAGRFTPLQRGRVDFEKQEITYKEFGK